MDPEVLYGTLENGIKYYIVQNAKPKNIAELRLYIDAGSVLED
jgi:zinc protease